MKRRCWFCNSKHAILDPVFRLPDPAVEVRNHPSLGTFDASDDYVRVSETGREPRFFVRGVILVTIHGQAEDACWG